MLMEIGICLYVLLTQQVLLIQADIVCYYGNRSSAFTASCSDVCCTGMPSTPQTACCSSVSWSTFAVPAFIICGVCLLTICLVYFRPLLKACLCGWKCPCGNRSRVTPPIPMSVNNNPVYIMNNGDLPDYETVVKDSPMKDITPPPYTFVAEHPTDFGIEARVPSAPPQYRSRCNSIATVGPIAPVQS